MKGFIVPDYMDRMHIAIPALPDWVNSGELAYAMNTQEGFENIPNTLKRIFTGKNLGKQLLKLDDPA